MKDGKLIQEFVMVSEGNEILYKPVAGGSISIMKENYGEYGLAWAVRYDSDGNEIDRFNCKHIAIITWNQNKT